MSINKAFSEPWQGRGRKGVGGVGNCRISVGTPSGESAARPAKLGPLPAPGKKILSKKNTNEVMAFAPVSPLLPFTQG